MRAQILVMAKAPVPGRVKTRLCPPYDPGQAAAIARAALSDTLAAVAEVGTERRVLVLSGCYAPPGGWSLVPQRGTGLAERLACAFADTARPGVASLVVGMDTPHLDPAVLAAAVKALADADAVLGPATDGGFWLLGLREPGHAEALRAVPMSVPDTGARAGAALRGRGLRLAYAPPLRDVDTAADAWAVARAHPHLTFAAAVRDQRAVR
jgi:rSAM/selenodomain-associated transferase 1